MVVLFVPIVLFPFWFTLTPSPPPHAELQILKYSGGLSLDSSFTQMSTPPEILSRVQGLKIAFNWSIYLLFIFSPYLFPELTHNGGFLNAFPGRNGSPVHFKLNTSQTINQSNKK